MSFPFSSDQVKPVPPLGFHVQHAGSRAAIVVALCLAGLGGCGDRGGSGTGDLAQETAGSVPGGTAVIALSSEPDVLNPLISASTIAGRVMAEIHEGLTEMDDSLAYVPRIASRWEIDPDRRAITYFMRRWRWSDGQPLTAFDVAGSFDIFVDPVVASTRRGRLREVSSAVALDSLTVRYTFTRPQAEPLPRSWHHILPLHVVGDLDRADVASWPINDHPLSSGPFQLESWDHNRQLTMVRNPLYPGTPALLERVVFRILPEASTRLVALETGEVDLVNGLDPIAARRLADGGAVRIVSNGGRSFYFVSWNLRNPIFADAGTRRALGLAFDRQRMVDNLLEGYGQPAIGPIPPVMWNHHVLLAPVRQDLAQAGALLAAAGWRDDDGDGVLERDGLRFEFEMITKQGDPVRENGAVILRSNLAGIGVKVNLRVMELSAGIAQVRAGRFDAYFGLQNANLFGNPAGNVRSDATDQFNFGAYANAEVDSLLDVATGLLSREDALPVWLRLQEVLADDPPAAYLMYPDNLVGVSRRLRNVKPSLLSPFNNLAEWWVPASERIYRTGK